MCLCLLCLRFNVVSDNELISRKVSGSKSASVLGKSKNLCQYGGSRETHAGPTQSCHFSHKRCL